MGRSVGISRVCRVKSFEIQQSTRIDRIGRNPYTLPVKKKDLQNYRSWRASRRTTRKKTRSRWRLGEHTSPFETCRRAIEKPEAVTCHSEESQRRGARTCISQTPCLSFHAWCSEIGSLWSLDASELHASSDIREPISLHQAVLSREHSSSPGWVIAKRESSSKVHRGARMPGQRRAGQLVTNKVVIIAFSKFYWTVLLLPVCL